MAKNPTSSKDSYKSEELNLSQNTAAFLNMLTKRGIIEDQQINNEKIRQAEKNKKRNMYHNTMALLHNYRSIVWVLECFPSRIAEELDRPIKDLDALLSLLSDELDMDNIKLENRLKSIQKSRLLLDRFNEALTILKQKPDNGAMMYEIIYQTYISPEKLNHLELTFRLNISTRHYYRLRAQAINIISIRLWTAPSAELDSWLEVLTLLEDL